MNAALVLGRTPRCSSGYHDARDYHTSRQRLVSTPNAVSVYCLRPADVEVLPFALDSNPMDGVQMDVQLDGVQIEAGPRSYPPKKLCRKGDVVEAGLRRWGGRERMDEERSRVRLLLR